MDSQQAGAQFVGFSTLSPEIINAPPRKGAQCGILCGGGAEVVKISASRDLKTPQREAKVVGKLMVVILVVKTPM